MKTMCNQLLYVMLNKYCLCLSMSTCQKSHGWSEREKDNFISWDASISADILKNGVWSMMLFNIQRAKGTLTRICIFKIYCVLHLNICYCRWNLWVPNLQMNWCDWIMYQGSNWTFSKWGPGIIWDALETWSLKMSQGKRASLQKTVCILAMVMASIWTLVWCQFSSSSNSHQGDMAYWITTHWGKYSIVF